MKLDKRLQDSLLKYCRAQISEQRLQRLAVARQVGRLRGYLKGEATDWFDTSSWRYRAYEDSPDYDQDNVPRYRYHINITAAAWQVLQAAIQTAGIPGSTFEPQNSKDLRDIETARVAKPIIDFEHKTINYRSLWMGIFRFFYTDGLVLAYEHHVRDAARWGITQTTVQRRNEITLPAGYGCQNCAQFHLKDQVDQDEQGNPVCPQCGSQLPESSMMAAENRVEIVNSTEDIAVGREIVDLYGALETVLPWWAPTLDKCPYAAIRTEVPPELVLQTFGDDFAGASESSSDGTEDYRFKIARQQAKTPKEAPFYPLYQFPTYGRWWLRPETFYRETDKGIRNELLSGAPQGLFLQEVNFEFADAIPEKMEDHLELMKAFESDGMYCPSIGQNGVPIQESVNTAWNQQLEADEFSAFPPVLMDAELLSGEGMKETKARPGMYKSVALPPGKDLRNSVFQIIIKENSVAGNRILDSFQMFMDYLVGISQALLGGSIVNTRSSEQYNTQRAQALQRQAPPYEAAKIGMAGVDEMLVNDFLANRTNEEFIAVVGASSVSMQEEASRLALSRGKIFAQAVESESIPQTWSQKQGNIDQMLESQNELIKAWVADPNNLQNIARAKALPDWHIPGLEQMEKMQRRIPMLLQMDPVPGQPQPDPQTGQMVPGPPTDPPIPFDAVFDDPKIQLAVIQEWAASEEGLQAQQQNPNFINLKLYAQACQQALAPNPPQPETPEQIAAIAQEGLVKGIQSPNVDKAGVLSEKTLEGLGILKKPKTGDLTVQ